MRVGCLTAVAVFFVTCLMCSGLWGLGLFAEGPGPFALAFILATTTAVPYGLALLWLDRNEQEPILLILIAFLWGATVATPISALFNDAFGGMTMAIIGNKTIASYLTAAFSAPFIEELTKGAAVALVFTLFKDEFDNVLDGILYGAMIGLGFAWFENIIYYIKAEQGGGIGGMLKLAYMRGVLSGLGSHAAYTGLTGLGFGLVRVLRRGILRWALIPTFLGTAMFAHFSWNALVGVVVGIQTAVLGQGAEVEMLVAFPIAVALLELPFVVLLGLVVMFTWRHENRIIRTYLSDEPDDVITTEEVDAMVPARRRAVRGCGHFFSRGPGHWWHHRKLAHECIELAFHKWHLDQDREITWTAEEDRDVHKLRDRIRARRRNIR